MEKMPEVVTLPDVKVAVALLLVTNGALGLHGNSYLSADLIY
jgi:hypothetical protein